MKRTILPFAIAAIAVVGIAAGLLLAGAGQTGPLLGGIAPSPTTLQPVIPMDWKRTILTLECSVLKNFSMGEEGYDDYLELHGRLYDERGWPVANQKVNLMRKVITADFFDHFTTVTTGYDGKYSIGVVYITDTSGKPYAYRAEFAGKDLFLRSRSPDVLGLQT